MKKWVFVFLFAACKYQIPIDYTAKNLKVNSKLCSNMCSSDVAATAVSQVEEFWSQDPAMDMDCLRQSISSLVIICDATERIRSPINSNVTHNGYYDMFSQTAKVGCRKKREDQISIMVHEISHHVLFVCLGKVDRDHSYMRFFGANF